MYPHVEHVDNGLDQLERIRALGNRNYGMDNPYFGTNKNECRQPGYNAAADAYMPEVYRASVPINAPSPDRRPIDPQEIVLNDAAQREQREIELAIARSLQPPEPGFRMQLPE